MPTYDIVFNEVPIGTNQGTKPTATSEILGPVSEAKTVKVSAVSAEDARAAVRAAFDGDTSKVSVVADAEWSEV